MTRNRSPLGKRKATIPPQCRKLGEQAVAPVTIGDLKNVLHGDDVPALTQMAVCEQFFSSAKALHLTLGGIDSVRNALGACLSGNTSDPVVVPINQQKNVIS